jgi:hypothetical protein
MKYLESGGPEKGGLMRLPLAGALLFLFGLWVSSFGMFFSRFSLDPHSVVTYYRGSEETFQSPRTFGSMVEVTHGHMAMMAVVLLLLTHLAIFLPVARKVKGAGIIGTFAAALLNEGSGWLVRFVDPSFAPLKLVAFFASQGFQIVLIVSLAFGLFRTGKRAESRSKEAALPVETEGAEPTA